MRLRALHLHGFKSFADRTALEFRDGVTAIVGSNGCGKSNLADAIRWVLGEQRASAVRGARMEEVIFQGTARRRPLSLAEVSLLFDNESGRVPIPQTEIEIARRVFREGGSEYSLNRNACRLRDVQSLLRDTGLGANAYAVIEGPMVEALLSDRAEERRALFEEAAGIGRYKDSRQAATRRLEAAEADLTRLEDLLSEVETKVRSLSRQKRKAERHRELQARRLDLEIAIARQEVARLEEGLAIAEGQRRVLDEQEGMVSAQRATTEASLEERRLEASELGRKRSEVQSRLEGVRSELDAREREVLVARERRAHAERRLEQLAEEQAALATRLVTLSEERARAATEQQRLASEVDAARERADHKVEANREIRNALGAERSATEAAAARARDRAREIATAEGERATIERRRRDALDRQADVGAQLERVRHELSQMSDQTDLWESEADQVREQLATARRAAEAARAEVEVLRAREQRAREEAREAEDRLASLVSQIEAREAVERNYEGFSPAVAAVMAARDRFPGVHGPLADSLPNPGRRGNARAYEAYLGSLLQALVVEDLATARAVRRWFREEWREGGSLLLLPLDRLRARASVAAGNERGTAGAPWLEILLSDLEVVSDDPLQEHRPGVAVVGAAGEVVDPRGVIRLLGAGDGQGILPRREALGRLRAEGADAMRQRDARLADRDALRAGLQAVEDEAVAAEEAYRAAEARLKSLELDAAAHRDRRGRLQRDRDAIETSLRSLEEVAATSAERLAALEAQLETLAVSVQEAGADESAARARLAELERRWDEARDQEAELRVSLARAEADLRSVERALQAAGLGRDAAEARMSAIDREREQIRGDLEGLTALREQAAGDIEALFRARDERVGAMALLDARLAELDAEMAELGEQARAARRREADTAEQRHRVDLELADSRSRLERVRERLEAEWGRPWSALLAEASAPLDGDVESWKRELRDAAEQLEGLGPINMLAVEEHAEEDRRLEFLLAQREDLVAARDNLLTAIRQIDRTAREVFQSTFDTVRLNFHRTFASLFEGGDCDIWLSDPDDPLESAVEIQASPVGKKIQRIHLLSGGERTLAALALLFALYLVKPSPFCVLDEIDAPLDDVNVGRFIRLLGDFKNETQFIVITHNPQTMEAADWVYGVTMEEPGVSTIVGVALLGAWQSEEATRTAAFSAQS